MNHLLAYINKLFNAKWKTTILLLVLLLPLFYLNINANHVWGDDFAQYLKQALNIAEGKNFATSNYIYNPDAKGYAPPYYPPGYSILLAPAVKFIGLNYTYLSYYNTCILVLLCISVFFFFTKLHINLFWSLILTLVFAYNPQTLDIKASCHSEIAATLFFMLYLLFRTDKKWYVFAALFASMAIFTRSIFIIIIAYEMMYLLILFFQKKWQDTKQQFYFFVVFTFSFFLLKYLFHPAVNHSDLQEYTSVMKLDEAMGNRFNLYLESMKGFLDFSLPGTLNWMILLIESFFLFTTISLMFYRSIKYKSAIDILLVLNFIIISMYTYPQGIRYLYPFLPVFIYYMYLAVNHFIKMINFPIHKLLGASLVIFSLIFFYKYKFEQNLTPNRIAGVNDVAVLNTFQFINAHYSTSDVFCFLKPRALALYTHVKTLHYPWTLHHDIDIKNNFKKYQVSHLMVTIDQNDFVTEFIQRNNNDFEQAISIERFLIYKFKNVQ
ncbi:MAG: hypothetical protein IPG85_17625 [Bacteroidetes bacterium]|nr:hypothetical protein [Bacteroidota bacterium]